ncbi:hypothetical protein GOQ04_03420 [Emticicia sp. ODNR4P]|nr:hypothetical protein [Emticicia sp. ODNR4P]
MENKEDVLAKAKVLIEESKNFLLSEGRVIELSDWLTIKNYCKKYNISEESVVTNWIRRGVIANEDIRIFPEFNNIRLIRDKKYK